MLTRLSENHGPPAVLRKIPYPYGGMLAICSDLDETPDRNQYFETSRFLNTEDMTLFGRGVGLEVGNTIYFDMPEPQFSFWNTDDRGRGLIVDCIRSGHIDCIHSYGENANSRRDAERAIGALERNGCRLDVWIDHATAPSNFGCDITAGRGDLESSEVYHADMTLDFGIRFAWLGRVTSVIGQGCAWSLRGIWNGKENAASAITVQKELAKYFFGALGNRKYRMHFNNDVMRKAKLRDGRHVYEFIRSNPNPRGVGCGATADGLKEVLTHNMLKRMVDKGGVCLLYTHLGKMGRTPQGFASATVGALKRLGEYSRNGKILVATTSRILRYLRAIGDLDIYSSRIDDWRVLRLSSHYPDDLGGVTVFTENPSKTALLVNDKPVGHLRFNSADKNGLKSVSLPWRRLEYPHS